MTAKDVMLDIEALGSPPDGVITQIGLRRFDRLTGELGWGLCVNVSIQSCLDYGLTVSGGAVKFWLDQPGRTFLKDPQSLPKALSFVSEFVTKRDYIWSHATFDINILEGAYRAIKQGVPFAHRNIRDIRTLVDLAEIKNKQGQGDPKTHNALDDCDYQVGYCVEMFRKLKGNDG